MTKVAHDHRQPDETVTKRLLRRWQLERKHGNLWLWVTDLRVTGQESPHGHLLPSLRAATPPDPRSSLHPAGRLTAQGEIHGDACVRCVYGNTRGVSQQGTTSRLQEAAQAHTKLKHPQLRQEGCADGRTCTSQKGRICAHTFNPCFLWEGVCTHIRASKKECERSVLHRISYRRLFIDLCLFINTLQIPSIMVYLLYY